MTLLGFYYTSMSVVCGLTCYGELGPEFDAEVKRAVKDALNDPATKKALDLTDTGVNRIADLTCFSSKVAVATIVGAAWPAYAVYNMAKDAKQLWKIVHT
jgi:hypothetical protein